MGEKSKGKINDGKYYLGQAKRSFKEGGDNDTAKQVEKIEKEVERRLDPQKG